MIARVEHAARQIETRGVALSRATFDGRPAGITQPEQLRDFIESFARCVIQGVTEHAVFIKSENFHEERVTAAHHQCDVRFNVDLVAKEWREQMTFEMVDREIRFAEAERETLGNRSADHQ